MTESLIQDLMSNHDLYLVSGSYQLEYQSIVDQWAVISGSPDNNPDTGIVEYSSSDFWSAYKYMITHAGGPWTERSCGHGGATTKISRVGKGVVNWRRHEMISGRYGLIHLNTDAYPRPYTTVGLDRSIDGKQGELFAIIEVPRFIGLWGNVEEKKIVLGVGTVFFAGDEIGLVPDDGRNINWFNPVALDMVHQRMINLYFKVEENNGVSE